MVNVRPKIVYQEEENKRSPLSIVWDVFVLLIFQFGVMDCIRVWMQLDPTTVYQISAISGVIGILAIMTYRLITEQYSFLIPICAAVIAVFVKGMQSVYYGLFGFVNYLISYWNVKQEDGVSLFMEQVIQKKDIEAFSLVLVLLMTALFWELVRRKSVVWTWIVPMLCVVTGLVIGAFSAFSCSAFLIGWLGIWLSKVRTRASFRRLIWLLVIGGLMIGAAVLSGSGQLPEAVQFKEQVTEAVNEIRNGKDTLPQGDLSKASQLLTGKDETLQVVTGQEKDMYLRGFVGAVYQDGQWSGLPKAAYKGEQSGMLKWLEESNFIPQNQYADYIGIENPEDWKENQVKVKNIGANRAYVYLPYSAKLVQERGVRTNQDMNVLSTNLFGKRQYLFEERSGSKPGELLNAENWVSQPSDEKQQEYAKAENVYAGFVYDNYLDVEDEMASMIRNVFYDGYEPDSEQTIYAITERIRDVLEKKAVYRKEPEAAPDGTEPISWFLNKGHQGNAVLFASAAVEAYRVQGIPARYVEGYLVKQQQVHEGDGNVTLTNQDSHAWVEVYLDGVGWIPIDVTPGFYYDTYTLLEMVKRPQNVNQTAAADDSDQQGNEIEDETKQANKDKKPERPKTLVIAIDGIIVVLFVFVLVWVLFEVVYVIRMLGIEKKYQTFSREKQTRMLEYAILRMLSIYGYEMKLGWNAGIIDKQLAETLSHFYPGEYIRITQIMEKHIYGEEELQPQEISVLYVFATRLYEARISTSFRKRLRIRYFFMNPVRRAIVSQQK